MVFLQEHLFCDIFCSVPFIADLKMLTEKREYLINESLQRANVKRHRHDYEINQKVLKQLQKPTKSGKKTQRTL